jgi:hypothetical protein
MAVRIKSVSKTDLCNVVVPIFTDGYKIKSHSSIITAVEAGIIKAGYKIKNTVYKATADGKLAYGTYYLEDEEDEEIGRMLTWVNAYTKQFKYRTISGIYIKDLKGCIAFAGDAYLKKYTGLGDEIANLNLLFAETIEKKNLMMDINLNVTDQATILGRLFAEYGVFTTEQASFFKTMITDTETLWDTYANVTDTLQSSHPKDWIRNQILVNYLFDNILELQKSEEEVIEHTLENNYGQPDNQTNLLNVIADLEAEKLDEDIRYALAAADEDKVITENFTVTLKDGTVVEHKMNTEGTIESITIKEESFAMAQLSGVKAPEDIVIHVESDQEYLERVADIEGEPEKPLMSVETIVFDLSKPDEPVTDLQEFNRLMDTVDTVAEEVEEDPLVEDLIEKINTVPSLEPTNEEYLLIEKELDQEIINVESLFEIAKPPVTTGILDEWDLSLDKTSSEDDEDEDEFFL